MPSASARTGKPHVADSIFVTVSGALYRLLIDDGGLEVTAKPLFGAVPEGKVARAAENLPGRLASLSGSERRHGGRRNERPHH